MREYTGLPNANVEFNNLNSNYRKPLSPVTHNTGNVGDFSHYWNSVWTKNIIGAATIQTINNVGSTINGDAYGTLTMNGQGTAFDKDAVAIPMWGMTTAFYRVAGAWVQRNAAFYFQQWTGAAEIDPYSDIAKTIYFITENKARNGNLDHIIAPSVDALGTLGTTLLRWGNIHTAVITPTTIDFASLPNGITDCLDEDTMASDSATKLATQQSIKAYVDGKTSGLTSGRVVIAGAAGALTDDADMTFATDTLTVAKIVASTRMKIPVGTNLYG